MDYIVLLYFKLELYSFVCSRTNPGSVYIDQHLSNAYPVVISILGNFRFDYEYDYEYEICRVRGNYRSRFRFHSNVAFITVNQ